MILRFMPDDEKLYVGQHEPGARLMIEMYIPSSYRGIGLYIWCLILEKVFNVIWYISYHKALSNIAMQGFINIKYCMAWAIIREFIIELIVFFISVWIDKSQMEWARSLSG